MRLAIDFDGVIHDHKNPAEGRKMGPPISGAIEALKLLKTSGHSLVVHTVWGGTPAGKAAIKGWLRFYGAPDMEVTNLKPKADLYLDDKAVHFMSWHSFLDML